MSAPTNDQAASEAVPFDGLLTVMAYAVAPNAALYVAVMDAAVAAREQFRLQLRPADIATAAGTDRDSAVAALNYLAEHGALARTYDPSEAETLAEFYKGAYLYQLTPAGLAAHRGVRDVLGTRFASSGRLSASLLPRIHEALSAVAADGADGDDGRLAADLSALFTLVAELSDSSATYLRELDAEVNALAADGGRLAEYKAAVLSYLEKFNRELGIWTPRIVEVLERLEPQALDLIARAARVDAAPRPDGTYDEGPVDELRGRWDGTVGWFRTRPGRTATAEFVNVAMVAAINRVLGAIARMHERRLRRVSREADFATLAAWFAAAEPGDAHRLWDAVTGLWPARHFYDPAGDESVDRRKSFWEAGAAELPPRVRTSTKRASPGRPGRRADYGAAKRVARQRARDAAAQAAAARTALAGRTPNRLSQLGELDPDEFSALLDVIGAALAEPTTGGVRTAVLPDATIRLTPCPDGARAAIQTPAGTWRGPDDLVDITVSSPARAAQEVS